MMYKNKELPVSERVENLLSKMTINEKVGQLNQRLYGFDTYEKKDDEFLPNQYFKDEVERFGGIGTLYGLFRADPWSGKTYKNGIRATQAARVANKFQRYIIENTRLGIPMLMATECPHGHQALDGYLLPTNLGASCTFNPELLEKAYALCSKQIRRMGLHLSLISTLDILRDPRWGRSEECLGEDPYLASVLAKAIVYGVQGRDDHDLSKSKDKTMMVAKHFCAQGETIGGLNASPASIGQRELYEIHLPAVKASCDAGVYSVMAAYNEIDGVMCHINKELLTDILRDEFGFKGAVMADGCALDRLVSLTSSRSKAAALALKAGMDISLWDDVFTHLEEAIENKEATMDELDRAVRRVLTLKFKMGLFENPYVEEDDNLVKSINYNSYDESLNIAREAVILLKNDEDILPLKNKKQTIAVIGPNANNVYNQIGDYVSEQDEDMTFTILEGIEKIAPQDTKILYEKGCGIRSEDKSGFDKALEIAKESDLIVFVPGGSSARDFDVEYDSNGAVISKGVPSEMDCGEGLDVSNLSLGGVQDELIDELAKLNKPIISLVVQGRPYCLTNVSQKSQALMTGFYPGPRGGLALAEILFGKINPSGKLSVSLPKTPYQFSNYYNKKENWANLKYIDQDNEPLYSFGHGLSYSEFEFSNLNTNVDSLDSQEIAEGKKFILTCDVENVSSLKGKVTVQLYISSKGCEITRRIKELKDFEKIELEPGEKKNLTFILDKEKLCFLGMDGKEKFGPQNIKVTVGDSLEGQLETKIRVN